jgi:hypothetical protein
MFGQRVTVVEGMCQQSWVPRPAFKNWCQHRHISWLSELPWNLKLQWNYHGLKNVRCLIAGWLQFRVLPELKWFVNAPCGGDRRSRPLNLSLTWTYRSWRKLHLLERDWRQSILLLWLKRFINIAFRSISWWICAFSRETSIKHPRGFVSREDEKQVKFVMGQYFEVSFFFCKSFRLFLLLGDPNVISCPPTSVDAVAWSLSWSDVAFRTLLSPKVRQGPYLLESSRGR